jgi:hypothetical protein
MNRWPIFLTVLLLPGSNYIFLSSHSVETKLIQPCPKHSHCVISYTFDTQTHLNYGIKRVTTRAIIAAPKVQGSCSGDLRAHKHKQITSYRLADERLARIGYLWSNILMKSYSSHKITVDVKGQLTISNTRCCSVERIQVKPCCIGWTKRIFRMYNGDPIHLDNCCCSWDTP